MDFGLAGGQTMVSVGCAGGLLRGTIRVWGTKGQAGAMPTFLSDVRSGVQPDIALRVYCHRYHGAETWNLLPGGCVGIARERGGPTCDHRGSNWSGPDPAPWLSLSSGPSGPHAFPFRPLLLHRTPVSPFRSPLPPPSEALLPPSVSLASF